MSETVIVRREQDRIANQLEKQPALALLRASTPDDIRAAGWAVAIHNDYRMNGVPHTFWLFTKGDRCVRGEGLTDAQALDRVREQLGPYELLRSFADVVAMVERMTSQVELCALNEAVIERSCRDHQPLVMTDEDWQAFTFAVRRKAAKLNEQDATTQSGSKVNQ